MLFSPRSSLLSNLISRIDTLKSKDLVSPTSKQISPTIMQISPLSQEHNQSFSFLIQTSTMQVFF